MSPHPILAPCVANLADAASWQPATPAELARFIATLYGNGDDNLVTRLSDLLDHLVEALPAVRDLGREDRSLIATHLMTAAERLGFIGESLDHARAATGRWDG